MIQTIYNYVNVDTLGTMPIRHYSSLRNHHNLITNMVMTLIIAYFIIVYMTCNAVTGYQ